MFTVYLENLKMIARFFKKFLLRRFFKFNDLTTANAHSCRLLLVIAIACPGISRACLNPWCSANGPRQQTPFMNTAPASMVTLGSAQLNGLANANGAPLNLWFKYGATPAMANSIQANPSMVTGYQTQTISAQLNGLLPNTIYYYCIQGTASTGDVSSDTAQFYTADCEIPNCDFELWDSSLNYRPVGWIDAGNVQKIVSYNGSNAVQLSSTFSLNAGAGVIALARPSKPQSYNGFPPIPISGGIPFPYRPDSIQFHTKYNIVVGDTAWVIMLFKKNGTVINNGIFAIAGSTAGNWYELAFPANFQTADVPDSLLLGFSSTNVFAHPRGASIIAIDDITFTGAGGTLPNWNFEQLDSMYIYAPHSWASNSYQTIMGDSSYLPLVARHTNAASGNYAIKIQPDTTYETSGTAIWCGSSVLQGVQAPAFPVAVRHNTFNFFARFFPENNDTLFVQAAMFLHDSVIGSGNLIIDTTIAQWAPFYLSINYGGAATLTPDSCSLSFSVGFRRIYGKSVAYIDNLSFDGFGPTDVNSPYPQYNARADFFTVFPNPSCSIINVTTTQSAKNTIELFDLAGSLIYRYNFTGNHYSLQIGNLPPSAYLIRLSNAFMQQTKKITVIR